WPPQCGTPCSVRACALW
ncbi:glucosyltransferase, partial, partial [Acetobacter tropicalis]